MSFVRFQTTPKVDTPHYFFIIKEAIAVEDGLK